MQEYLPEHTTDRNSTKKFFLVPVLILVAILIVDQYFKYWVKHNMFYGTQKTVIGDFFYLYFIENNGMAFGYELGGEWGKILLTFFRIFAVLFGGWYFLRLIKRRANRGLIIAIALILAGALGNIIDSVFYGVLYSHINDYPGGWMHGRVVDMLYFPIVKGHYPGWFPVLSGQEFIFFRPIFNIADAAITSGVLAILFFQKRYFQKAGSREEKMETEPATPYRDPSEPLLEDPNPLPPPHSDQN